MSLPSSSSAHSESSVSLSTQTHQKVVVHVLTADELKKEETEKSMSGLDVSTTKTSKAVRMNLPAIIKLEQFVAHEMRGPTDVKCGTQNECFWSAVSGSDGVRPAADVALCVCTRSRFPRFTGERSFY